MGAIIATYERLAFMDLTQGYFYTTNALMIPMPENENNLAAAVKPFQLSVSRTEFQSFHFQHI